MSTPERPWALDPAYPGAGTPCCEGRTPHARWQNFVGITDPPALQEFRARSRATVAGQNPDRLWCSRCSTTLEDFRDNFADAFPEFLNLIASVVAFIPGFGTLAADVLGTVAALAAGESLSEAVVKGAMAAIPGGPLWSGAANFAGNLLEGKRIDVAASAGVRAAIREEGGDLAAAAYDGVLAIAQGKAAQDAGFAVLNAYAKGNTLGEKLLHFGESVSVALEQGQGLPEVLLTELATDVFEASSDRAAAMIDDACKRLLSPELRQLGTEALAVALGMGEPIARATQVIMADGTPDPHVRAAILASVDEKRRQRLFAQTAVALPSRLSPRASAALTAASARASMLQSKALAVPGALDVLARAKLGISASPVAALRVPRPLEPVAVAAPVALSAPRNGLAADLALGGVVTAAGVALFLWARSK